MKQGISGGQKTAEKREPVQLYKYDDGYIDKPVRHDYRAASKDFFFFVYYSQAVTQYPIRRRCP